MLCYAQTGALNLIELSPELRCDARLLELFEKHGCSGITLDSALSLSDLPEGSAVITGSTIVQACLGELWGGCGGCDVDVFCTAKDAPKVRSVSTLFHIDLG